MKFNVYLKNKGILKISIFLFEACIDLGGSWLIVSEGQLSAGHLFLVLGGSNYDSLKSVVVAEDSSYPWSRH